LSIETVKPLDSALKAVLLIQQAATPPSSKVRGEQWDLSRAAWKAVLKKQLSV